MRRRQLQAGFTLLEVLVAMAILGVAIVASIQGFAAGLRLLKLAGEHQHAVLLADQKLREPVALEEGRETGTEDSLSWERAISIVQTPGGGGATTLPGVPSWSTATTGPATTVPGSPAAAAGSSAPATAAAAGLTGNRWRMYRIAVKVQWEKRFVELATLRTVPLDAMGQPRTGTPITTPLVTGGAQTGTAQPVVPPR